jgi:hypothetical protein
MPAEGGGGSSNKDDDRHRQEEADRRAKRKVRIGVLRGDRYML